MIEGRQAPAENVLIIGGNGFLGQHTAASLSAAGGTVHIFDRPGSVPTAVATEDHSDYRYYEGSITQARELEEAVAEARPDAIILLASYSHQGLGLVKAAEQNPAGAVDVNIVGLLNVLDIMTRRPGTHLLWLSSTTVYGSATMYEGSVVTEGSLLLPRSVYAATKLLGEQLIRTHRSTQSALATAIRPTLIWGPGLRYRGVQSCLGEMVTAAAEGREVRVVDSSEPWDMLYVRDAGRALAWSVGRDLGPVALINGYQASVRQVREAVLSAVPDAGIHVEGSAPYLDLPAVDDSRIREAGFAPQFDLIGSIDDYLATARKSQ